MPRTCPPRCEGGELYMIDVDHLSRSSQSSFPFNAYRLGFTDYTTYPPIQHYYSNERIVHMLVIKVDKYETQSCPTNQTQRANGERVYGIDSCRSCHRLHRSPDHLTPRSPISQPLAPLSLHPHIEIARPLTPPSYKLLPLSRSALRSRVWPYVSGRGSNALSART
jgi:hypothetical protein